MADTMEYVVERKVSDEWIQVSTNDHLRDAMGDMRREYDLTSAPHRVVVREIIAVCPAGMRPRI